MKVSTDYLTSRSLLRPDSVLTYSDSSSLPIGPCYPPIRTGKGRVWGCRRAHVLRDSFSPYITCRFETTPFGWFSRVVSSSCTKEQLTSLSVCIFGLMLSKNKLLPITEDFLGNPWSDIIHTYIYSNFINFKF